MNSLEDFVSLGEITLDELTEARIALQDIVIRLACERATEADLGELEAIAKKTKTVTDVDQRYQCAVDYYAVLARSPTRRQCRW